MPTLSSVRADRSVHVKPAFRDIVAAGRLRALPRSEYDRMVLAGLLDGERVQLLGGAIVTMSPQGTRHAGVIGILTRLLILRFADRAQVHIQLPFALSDFSEPEPDAALVPPGDYLDDHPSTAYLVIEVANTSLRDDRGLKAELYAAAGVPEYCVLDVNAATIEVFSQPEGERYASQVVKRVGETIAPAAFPDVVLELAELMPWAAEDDAAQG